MKRHLLLRVFSAMVAVQLFSTAPMVYAQEENAEVVAEEVAEETPTEASADTPTEQAATVEIAEEETELDVSSYVEAIEEEGNKFRVGNEIPEDAISDALAAVQKKVEELHGEGIVTEFVARDSNILIKFANGYEYTWESGTVAEGVEGEDKDNLHVLQPASETPEQSNEETTRWSPVDSDNKTQQFVVAVPSATVRYEIFYTAGETPHIAFKTTTAKEGEYLIAGNDIKEDGEDGFKFITKANLTIEGHDDFRYMVIYISNTKDPGRWTMTVTAPANSTEVIAVSSQVPDDWEELVSDTITKPYGVIFWYVDAKKSQYREQPIATINELISAKSSVAAVDNLQTTVEEPVDYTPIYVFFGVLGAIVIIVVVVILLVKNKKKNRLAYIAKREEIVRKENEKVRKKKNSENDELDDIMDDFSDEYIDDDVSDYINVDDSSDDSDMFTEDEDDGFYEDNSYDTAQRVRDKLSDDTMPSWDKSEIKTDAPAVQKIEEPVQKQEENVPAFLQSAASDGAKTDEKPAWMTNVTTDSNDFF